MVLICTKCAVERIETNIFHDILTTLSFGALLGKILGASIFSDVWVLFCKISTYKFHCRRLKNVYVFNWEIGFFFVQFLSRYSGFDILCSRK